jgi:hypothetical protein
MITPSVAPRAGRVPTPDRVGEFCCSTMWSLTMDGSFNSACKASDDVQVRRAIAGKTRKYFMVYNR